ncbi:MAG: sulfur carrier protein ThiS [Planctomycetota bacterium]
MQITLNGEPYDVAEGTTLEGLIATLGLADAACAAEVNGSVVPKHQHPQSALQPGDTVELVTLVGGG